MGDLVLVKYKRPPCPCNGCVDDRSEDCHASCEKYLSWRDVCDKGRDAYTDALNRSRIIEEYNVKKIQKHKKMKPMW